MEVWSVVAGALALLGPALWVVALLAFRRWMAGDRSVSGQGRGTDEGSGAVIAAGCAVVAALAILRGIDLDSGGPSTSCKVDQYDIVAGCSLEAVGWYGVGAVALSTAIVLAAWAAQLRWDSGPQRLLITVTALVVGPIAATVAAVLVLSTEGDHPGVGAAFFFIIPVHALITGALIVIGPRPQLPAEHPVWP